MLDTFVKEIEYDKQVMVFEYDKEDLTLEFSMIWTEKYSGGKKYYETTVLNINANENNEITLYIEKPYVPDDKDFTKTIKINSTLELQSWIDILTTLIVKG